MTLGTNLLLAIVWAALIGPFSPMNLAVGFVVGHIVLRVCAGPRGRFGYVRRSKAFVALVLFTIWEVTLANLRVARYTVSPLGSLRPGVLAVPVAEGLTDVELTLLASLITLTPGTLTLDISEDRLTLYIHFMHVEDVDEAIRGVRTGFERRILEVTR